MNNKEFVSELSERLGYSSKDISSLITGFVAEVRDQLEEGNIVSIQGFGTFDVKKKMERVVVNPATKQHMLVPPKMVVNFKASNTLKDKFKN